MFRPAQLMRAALNLFILSTLLSCGDWGGSEAMPSETAPITANQAEICNEDTSGLEIVLRAFDQANRTLSFAIITEPTKGTLGTLYMVDDQYVIIYTPNPNENGEDFFTYIASNGDLNSNETKVTINIYAVNDAPVASFSGPSSVAEDGEAINFALSATDVDGQTGFTFVLKAPPAKGTLAISGEQAVYTPGPDEFGADSFVFVANDGAADSDEITVNLTITPINDAPQISGTPVNATEDTPYSFQMTGTDVDGDSLTYSLINNPGWISIDPDTGELSGTPLYTDEATGLSFTVKVVDDSGEAGNNTAEIVVSLDVIGVNDPPVITGLPADATEDTPYSNTSIAATDEEGDALIFTLAGPEWLSIDPDTGELSGLPLNEHVGENPITITVTAENGASDVLEGTILVINTNDAPLLDPALPKLAVVSGDFPLLVDLSQHFTEVDIGDVLSYSVASSDETTVYGEITGSYLKINKGEGTSKIVVMTVSAHDATASTEGDLYVFFPQSLYANGLNWMDYVKHDGNDVFSAQDIPCDGSETGGYEACVHGGEIRMIETSLETAANPCANLSGSDTLGAFEWVCDDAGPNLVFYSKRLQDGKYLSDLIDFDGATWLENSLVVNDGAEDIYTSMPAKWWGNPIVVDNDGIAPTVSEEKTGTIYLVTSNPDATYIYDKDKIGLVIRPGVSLSLSSAPSPNQVVLFTNSNFHWFEGDISSDYGSPGLALYNTRFSVVRGAAINLNNPAGRAVFISSSSNNRISDITLAGSLETCWNINSSHFNDFANLDASGCLYPANIVTSHDNTFTDFSVSGGLMNGIYLLTSSRNSFSGIESSKNSMNGIALDFTSEDNTFRDITVYKNTLNGISISSSARTRLFDINTSRNVQNGIYAQYSPYTSIAGVNANNNHTGLKIVDSGFSTLTGITSTSNTQGIELDYLISNANIILKNSTINNNNYGLTVSGSDNVLLSGISLANNGNYGLTEDQYAVGLLASNRLTVNDMSISNSGEYGIFMSESSDNYFTGQFNIGFSLTSNCLVLNSTNPGLTDSTCALSAGASDASVSTGVTMGGSFLAKAASDSSNGNGDTLPFSYLESVMSGFDWINFENSYRNWGLDGNSAFPHAGQRGKWSFFLGGIWDWRLAASDAIIRDVRAVPAGDDTLEHAWLGPAADQAACEAAFPGSIFVDTDDCRSIFLKNAIEIPDDSTGNGNLLCESGEICLYTPNMASYQGHGNLVSAGSFTNGAISGVTLLKYETNGVSP